MYILKKLWRNYFCKRWHTTLSKE